MTETDEKRQSKRGGKAGKRPLIVPLPPVALGAKGTVIARVASKSLPPPPHPPVDAASIPELARDALGGFADEWLNTPNLHLDLKTPLQAAGEGGAWEQVARDILLAYKYGIFG